MNKFASAPKKWQPSIISVSWSKLKNYETCPYRYQQIDVLKNYPQPSSPELAYGDRMHKSFEHRVRDAVSLPDEFVDFEKWMEYITIDSDHPDVTIFVELELCIGKDLKPREYRDWKEGWFRGKVDFLKIKTINAASDIALAVDYKSGNPKPDIPQLGLMAQLVFAHYPRVRAVKTMYLWTKVDDTTEENLYPSDMAALWTELNPRFAKLEAAHRADDFPKIRGGLCKDYCAVVSCEHNGKR